ncbi:MAG: hypothetical protein KDD70_00080 [Bdellovibrionales bacterium]|nr:hypothetical protein [Bdellovibrionales bacterium]
MDLRLSTLKRVIDYDDRINSGGEYAEIAVSFVICMTVWNRLSLAATSTLYKALL